MKVIIKIFIGLIVILSFIINFNNNDKESLDQKLNSFIQIANASTEDEPDCDELCVDNPNEHCVGNYKGTVYDCEDMYNS